MATAYSGKKLFELKSTKGSSLDVEVDRILNEKGQVIEWKSFVDEARKNQLWDFQTVEEIEIALADAKVDRKTQSEILREVKSYMKVNPLHGPARVGVRPAKALDGSSMIAH